MTQAASRSSKADARAETQRRRILRASQQCFIQHGFHGASMANIADTAGMSAGLIYRYFAGKSDIILAIVQEQLTFLRDDMLQVRKVDVASEIVARFGATKIPSEHGMNAVLLLEISAESTRDSRVAAALDEFDGALRSGLEDWLTRAPDNGGLGLPPALAPMRALLLQCMIEGLKVRETREPGLDRAMLLAAMREFADLLASGADSA